MKLFKTKTVIALLLFSVASFGQTDDSVEMADMLRQDGKIYTVVFGLVVILTAMIVLLIRIDRKIFNLEKRPPEKNK